MVHIVTSPMSDGDTDPSSTNGDVSLYDPSDLLISRTSIYRDPSKIEELKYYTTYTPVMSYSDNCDLDNIKSHVSD
jgi:hypothetical protein